MFNRTEADEKQHLSHVQARLTDSLQRLRRRVGQYARDAREQKAYIWEHKGDMDHAEKVSARESADQIMRSGEVALAAQQRLEKLIDSPYFGRVDFAKNGNGAEPLPVYVGVHAFTDEDTGDNLVFDWRAPVSTLFYDYETGPARYRAPVGEVTGDIRLKRQYRIREGRLELMLESGLSILDEVLQDELSRATDDRMKNIVATIQRDQNAIIRNEDAEALVIQGVAGSGKTSIALHRVAFLLYRHRDTLSSRDVLIISPNRVFADFISNVLPELGEEPIGELAMEELADELLQRKQRFESAFEEAQRLLEGRDPDLKRRVEFKSTVEFLHALDRYAAHLEKERFRAEDVKVGGHVVDADTLEAAWRRRPRLPPNERLRWVAECAEQEAWKRSRREIGARDRAALKAAVRRMVRRKTLRKAYQELFQWLGEPALYKRRPRATLEHSDVFPMIYLKLLLEGGGTSYGHVQHLVVDEMQDYTPVHYAVLAKLFRCDKTVLGDVGQSLNAASTSADTIGRLLPHSECVELTQSYRSSYDITRFAQAVAPGRKIDPIERHGRPPVVAVRSSGAEERARLVEELQAFGESRATTLGIICKTQKHAERLRDALADDAPGLTLLSPESTSFSSGPTICATHLAKGLEFDWVVVPGASDRDYATELDRNLLFVACTRAMHRLTLTCAGRLTPFVGDPSLYRAG